MLASPRDKGLENAQPSTEAAASSLNQFMLQYIAPQKSVDQGSKAPETAAMKVDVEASRQYGAAEVAATIEKEKMESCSG